MNCWKLFLLGIVAGMMRLLVVVVAGVVAYFATLLLLGFRVKEFARRTA